MTEREWREAKDMRRATLTLAIIVLLAALLRFWHLGHGIPYAIGVDEPEIIDRATGMMKTGEFNPRFFDYPSLYIYVQLIVSTVRFLVGATSGEWTSLAQVHPEDFLLWGRAVTAALGSLTVLLVYAIGMRWGTRYALLAAGMMAVMPLHVRESHYVLTDVPVTFFVTLAFLLSLRAHEQPDAKRFAWAGVAAGLAAATKYPGALVLLLPLVAVWMTPAARPSRLSGALAAIGAAAGAYFLAAPYTILDLPGFLNGYAKLAGSYTGTIVEPGWSISFKHLQRSMSWPATLAVLGGMGLAIVRAVKGPGRVRWTLALLFPLVYFWFVSKQSLIFGRYLIPVLPFACVLAAAGVVSGVGLLRRYEIPRAARTVLVTTLTIAALLPPAVVSVQFNRMISKRSTTELAYRWLRENIPPGSSIVMESRALAPRADPYRFINVVQLRMKDYGAYRAENVDYLIASSQCYGPYLNESHKYPREYAEYMSIFTQSRELARFTPDGDHPGPELRILKVVP